VAVKRWRGGASHQGIGELMREVTMLSQVAHVNVLPVLGFACEPPDLMLVTPYLPRGSLHDALHGAGGAGGAGLDAAWRVSFAAGLAHGIRVLHEAQIVHRDIKGANVLIAGNGDSDGDNGAAAAVAVAVLGDAGVARRMRVNAQQDNAATATRVIGTDGYLDPEYQEWPWQMLLATSSNTF
jgi:serine/threonine protein kinase